MFEGLDSNGQPLYQDSVPSTSQAVPAETADWVNVEPHSGSSSPAMSLEVIEASSARPVEERPVLNDSMQARPSSSVLVVSLNDDLSGGELILTPRGQSTDQGDSRNTSGQYSGLRIPSQEAEIHPVSPDLFEQHPSLASVAYHDESPFPTPSNSQGSSADYPSLNEEARSLPSSQDSYSGMNPDSPAGSQPQSMFSLPMQFPSSQPSSDQGQCSTLTFLCKDYSCRLRYIAEWYAHNSLFIFQRNRYHRIPTLQFLFLRRTR